MKGSSSMNNWLTIPEFENVQPIRIYHKAMDTSFTLTNDEEHQNVHVLVRGHFELQEGEEYLLRLSADDYYKAWLNGTYLGQGPAPSNPEYYYYNEIPLKAGKAGKAGKAEKAEKAGEQVLALHLYYQGLVNRVWNSADHRFGFYARLIRQKDGVELPIRWKYQICEAYSGETIAYDTQFLENFDSRKWDPDWNQKICAEEGWQEPVPASWADYTMEKSPIRMLEIYEERPSVIRENGERKLWIDFGHELTGGLKMTAKGPSGSRIIMRCGEELKEDGSVRWEMRCFCNYQEIWTLAGREETLIPYDYKGFRYAEIEYDEGVELIEIAAQVRHYPMDRALCTLESDNETLVRIFELCKRGVQLGTQEGYMDCPTREKGQYLGDGVVTGRSQTWLSGNTEMIGKCTDLFARSAMICPGLMAVTPGSYMQEIADYSLMYSDVVMTFYEFSGDIEVLRKYEPVIHRMLDYFAAYEREDGLLGGGMDKWNMVDWPANLRDDYAVDLPNPGGPDVCHNVINAIYIGALKKYDEIRSILGMNPLDLWQSRNERFYQQFFSEKLGCYVDTEHGEHGAIQSNLFPLYYGLIPEDKEQAVCDLILKKGLCCGVMMSYFLLKGLCHAGRYEDAYHLIINESAHGWVQMLRDDATACLEAWGKDQKWNTSLCHPWASAPISVIIEELAGIHPDPSAEKGYRLEPHIPKELKNFRLKVSFRGQDIIISR